ncbi:MAG: serine/threonine protein kinase with repeat [Deltaproteobacteria bacterium]|nr:serine/threonine protein kinase with repeat [Deltaproteobacteria bacterium]
MSQHEMSASITCAGCQHAYVESALFCPNCGRPKARAAASDALIGKVLGERFEVIEPIGQGSSGTIYRAEHVTLRRKVAIKVLHDELSRDDLAVERFRREATTVAEIDNEHIVEIHDFGRTPDGRLYLAMELLEGETLDAVLARETQLSIERTADILIQVGEALMEAHAIGYVHRDLRPRNVYLANRRGKANFVKLLDFGLAKLVETDASAASTSLGMTFGDPRYMSPEQARGDRIDRRADIYQLGCVAYEMLTGAPPFGGNRVFDILTKQVTEVPVPLPTRRPGVPLWVEAAVAKMLAKSPENRFATTTRMVEALRRGLETGEIMEDEVARRRESVPPPSVSRVMAKMGITTPQDPPAPPTADSIKPARPAHEPIKQALPAYDARATARGLPPGPPAPPANPANPDSVELLRKRTGTPQLGVPGIAAAVAGAPTADPVEPQSPRAGTIDPSPAVRVSPPIGPVQARIKRPTAEPGISQVWYDDGDRASEDVEHGHSERARNLISPSATDLGFYDEAPRGRRWGLIVAALGAVVVIGGVAFALSRGDTSAQTASTPRAPSLDPIASAAVSIDAAPSTVISSEVPDAAAPAVAPEIPSGVASVTKPTPTPPPTIRAPGGGARRPADLGSFVPPGGDPIRRTPGDTGVVDSHPTPVVIPPPTNAGTGSGGVSGTPLDPYGGGNDSTPPTDGAPVANKAEFYGNLGTQQLGTGDTTSAASSFKKALELDANNAIATIGMGEIALRQGLFGDAIAHLKKAARIAPRSSRVFTLLGEAYLNSGQSKDAATNFKKALQLDPDNTRARDGYNEASSRVPPASDEP